jgi:hypothetical protein
MAAVASGYRFGHGALYSPTTAASRTRRRRIIPPGGLDVVRDRSAGPYQVQVEQVEVVAPVRQDLVEEPPSGLSGAAAGRA